MNLDNIASDGEMVDIFVRLSELSNSTPDSCRDRASALVVELATAQKYNSIFDSEEDAIALNGMIQVLTTIILSGESKIFFHLPITVLLAYLLGKRRGFQNNLPIFVVAEEEEEAK